jgi:hypothetical protein
MKQSEINNLSLADLQDKLAEFPKATFRVEHGTHNYSS